MNRRRITAILAAAAILTALAVPAHAAVKKAATVPAPITFVYAGDSITALPGSWLDQMQTDARFQAIGGFAQAGYRSDQVLANISPTAATAQVLVIEVGTNDINQQVRATTILANIDAIVDKMNAQHVLIVAAPPSDVTSGGAYGTNRQAASFTLNRFLSTHAADKGWLYGDPFQFVRAYNNGYDSGASADGVHPTAETNTRVEKLMGLFIQQANLAAKS